MTHLIKSQLNRFNIYSVTTYGGIDAHPIHAAQGHNNESYFFNTELEAREWAKENFVEGFPYRIHQTICESVIVYTNKGWEK
jgi:hypothetical protein